MDMKVVSRNVSLLRVALGLEQKDLARLAGVSKAYVSRLEGGQTRHPRATELDKIAAVFGMVYDQLRQPLMLVFGDRLRGEPGERLMM